MRKLPANKFIEISVTGKVFALFYAEDRKLMFQKLFTILARQSSRRALGALLAKSLYWIGLERLYTRQRNAPLFSSFDSHFYEWLQSTEFESGGGKIFPLIVLPPQGLRRGRLYVYCFDARGKMVAFTKIGLDADNKRRLEKEANILLDLSELESASFRTPKIISKREVGDWLTISLECLPRTARPILINDPSYDKIFSIYQGTASEVTIAQLLSEEWARIYKSRIAPKAKAFDDELTAQALETVWISRAHGDPGPHNFFQTESAYWIIDWEDSDLRAPILTDRLSLDLGSDRDRIKINPSGYLDALLARHSAQTFGESRRNVMLALAYRAAAGHSEALALIGCWTTGQNE